MNDKSMNKYLGKIVNDKFLIQFSILLSRLSSGFAIFFISLFTIDFQRKNALIVVATSAAIAGIFSSSFGEYVSYRFYKEIVSKKYLLLIMTICTISSFLDSKQLLAQSILQSYMALKFQAYRVEKYKSFLMVTILFSLVRMIFPIIYSENVLEKQSLCQLLITFIFILDRNNNSKENMISSKKLRIRIPLMQNLVWFVLQQNLILLCAKNPNLSLNSFSHLLLAIKIFEASTVISHMLSIDAPRYLRVLDANQFKDKIYSDTKIQFVTLFITMLVLIFYYKISNELDMAWIMFVLIIAAHYVFVSLAVNSTPTILLTDGHNIYLLSIALVTLILISLQWTPFIENLGIRLFLSFINYSCVYWLTYQDALKKFNVENEYD